MKADRTRLQGATLESDVNRGMEKMLVTSISGHFSRNAERMQNRRQTIQFSNFNDKLNCIKLLRKEHVTLIFLF